MNDSPESDDLWHTPPGDRQPPAEDASAPDGPHLDGLADPSGQIDPTDLTRPSDIITQTEGDESEELGGLVRTGLVWSFVNTGLGRGVTFLSTIVLAHLLTPKDFGVFAVALLAMTFLMSLNDVGIAAVVVRWQGNLDEVGPTATTLIFAASAVLFVLMFTAAPAFADALHAPSATGVVRLMCCGLLIDACAAVPAASLTRSLQQRRRAVADLSGSVVGISVSIALAAAGAGAWSLAWGRIATNVIVAIVVLVLAPSRYRPQFNRVAARRLLDHGLPFAGSTLLAIAVLNVDYVTVGRVLGPTELGLYLLAFNLSSWPINLISTSVRRVTVAGFARLLEQREALDSAFRRAQSLTVAVAAPMCALLATLAPQLITFVYGSKWSAAASALRWLAILGLLRILLDLSWDLLVAVNRSREVLWLNAAWLVFLIPALAAGAHLDGIRGVGIGHVVVALVIVAPLYALALRREGLHIGRLARALTRPMLGGLLAACVGIAAGLTFNTDIAALVVGGVVAALLLAPLLWPMRTSLRGLAAAT
jgi:PST family polysaccharide transporter